MLNTNAVSDLIYGYKNGLITLSEYYDMLDLLK